MLTSSLDVINDICNGGSIAIRKRLSTGELGMFKEGRDGKGRVWFGKGLAMAGHNILKRYRVEELTFKEIEQFGILVDVEGQSSLEVG